MFARVFGAVLAMGALSACAGQHVRPSGTYAKTEANVVRVAYDQEGDTYPRNTNSVDWATFQPSWYQSRFGGPFRLRDHYESSPGDQSYEAVRQQAQLDAANELNGRLKDGDTLVILIHGFNNTYKEAVEAYDLIRPRVTVDPSDVVFLEVFWDGLQLRSDKARDKAGYASFWPDALTYSNFAGQYGLRGLLNAVKHDVDVRFVTHSRGVAVALSSLADPLYDPEIICPDGIPCHGRTEGSRPPLANPHIQSVKIAAFAPAIGTGHLHSGLDASLAAHPVTLLAGLNTQDFATSKAFLSSRVWGDTSLGSDPGYVLDQQSLQRKHLMLRTGLFKHGSEHALASYFSDAALTTCFFAAIDLHHAGPAQTCALIGPL